MSRFVVDASVAAKWFFEESHTVESSALLSTSHELHGPDLMLLEVDNVVCKRLRRGEVSRENAEVVRVALRRMPVRLHTSRELLDAAFEIAAGTGRSLYDCIYLALAVALDARMVTADRRFYEGIRSTHFATSAVWIADADREE